MKSTATLEKLANEAIAILQSVSAKLEKLAIIHAEAERNCVTDGLKQAA